MCWLCTYQGGKLWRKLNAFIIQNIGYMEMACISQLLSDYILIKEPDAVGATPNDVFAHVQSHMLHPRVRMAVMLRQLLEFAGLLQNSMVVRDGDLCTVDKGNADLYLKVITQVPSPPPLDARRD